jgi:signal transduction histidine kinase/CheY-like chemotaxis protein
MRIPADTVYNFSTTSGEMKPREIITIPVKNTKGVLAVISLSSIYEYPPTALRLIKDILPTMTARMNGVLLFDEITGLANKLEQQNAELQAQKNELAAQAAEVAEQNIELEMQKKELDESNRLKSVFLSNMSHELRTPLNSVIALSGVLSRRLENQIPETEYSYLEVIGRNGSHLLSLINDILDISRIESGKVEFDYSQFHPSSLIDDLVNMIRPQAIEKGINLKVDIPADNPLLISDYTKCRHILQNLIGNAVKFTNKGDVSIRMEKQDDMLGFVVSDTGIGIHQDKIKHIFDEFRQADESTSRKYGGTGLGLAIAQKYAVLLYGRIEVRSVPEQGSTFTFWLPVENHQLQISSVQAHPSTDQKIPQPDKQETVMEGIGRTILVVEDSEPAIIQLQDILHEQGYQTRVAKNGREALEQIALTIPDGIILDLMMPEVDGFEVLKTLRSNESTARVPVLILTAKHVTKAEISFLASNHIYQLIQKGDVKKSALLKQISSMLDHRLQDDQVIESHSAKPDADRIDRKLKHSNTPLVLIVEDNADNLLTIKALLSDEYKTLEAMDGKSGVELARRYKPDLILMDIALPVMNGLQALTAIREYEDLRHIPIIAVTASVMKGNREEILQYGFDGFVAKPINHTIFFEVIEGVLYGAK